MLCDSHSSRMTNVFCRIRYFLISKLMAQRYRCSLQLFVFLSHKIEDKTKYFVFYYGTSTLSSLVSRMYRYASEGRRKTVVVGLA